MSEKGTKLSSSSVSKDMGLEKLIRALLGSTFDPPQQRANFAGQNKELVLHPKGNLSRETYDDAKEFQFLYGEEM